MTKSTDIPKKPIELDWDDDVAEAEQKTITRDCGVGSSADMPRNVWVVVRELNANPFDVKPIAAFCNKRFAQFWIANQPEHEKRKYQYFVYPALGNPEAFESIPEQ